MTKYLKLILTGLSIINYFQSKNFYWILVALYWFLNYIDGLNLGKKKEEEK